MLLRYKKIPCVSKNVTSVCYLSDVVVGGLGHSLSSVLLGSINETPENRLLYIFSFIFNS